MRAGRNLAAVRSPSTTSINARTISDLLRALAPEGAAFIRPARLPNEVFSGPLWL